MLSSFDCSPALKRQATFVFWYFGYGSNMDLTALKAKGVEPLRSCRAQLPDWQLRFNVRHFFQHEGGVANIEPSPKTGKAVHGVLHLCEDEQLALLDRAEACGHGYDRVEVEVRTASGPRAACAYIGLPAFLDENCRPTRRYLNILLRGGRQAQLDAAYLNWLEAQPIHCNSPTRPFRPPTGDFPSFDAESLRRYPLHTALAGSVFDMSGARPQHEFLKDLFGGRDMTLYHLQRLDSSQGNETLDDVRLERYSKTQRQYLDDYLQAYAQEYVYAGHFRYDVPSDRGAVPRVRLDLPHPQKEAG
jgi:sulfite reductase (NADPH) flavoprotein alpha-component